MRERRGLRAVAVTGPDAPRFRELQRVALVRAVPDVGLAAGAVGTVVGVYADGIGYEVEFTEGDGHTAAVLTLTAADIRVVL